MKAVYFAWVRERIGKTEEEITLPADARTAIVRDVWHPRADRLGGLNELALQDEFEDWRDGEMLIQSLIETPEEVDRAAAHQARLEKLLIAAGGIAGPGTIGGK